MNNNIQYNAAVKYLENNAYKISLEKSRAIKIILGAFALTIFLIVLKLLFVK